MPKVKRLTWTSVEIDGAGNVKSAAEHILAQENSISRNLRDSRQLLLFSSNF
jgi:hypothetical protein